MRTRPVLIRNKEHGSIYRIIRTTTGWTREGKVGLYWIVKGRNPDGTWHRSTSWLSVDSFVNEGQWEIYES